MDASITKAPVLSRRGFLKTGATLAALGTSSSLLTSCAATSRDASSMEEKIAYTYHPVNCGNRCSWKCTVRDGRLVHVEGNDWQGVEEGRYSVCCLKGMSEIERNYGPDRVQTPLKRVGERGSGDFQEISWEEALDTIADTIKEVGGEHVLFPYSAGIEYPYPFLRTCTGGQSAHEIGFDMGQGNGLDPSIGFYVVGITPTEPSDWMNTRTMFIVGCNVLETTMTEAKTILDAKEAGMELIVIDPVHTVTAAKADQFVGIRPGTDPALYLGMASAILDNGWYDEEFMKAHTTMPFLVDSATGALLREKATVAEEDTPETNPFLIWDARTRNAVPFNQENVDPALEGEFTHEGKKFKTVFTLVKENQAEHTVEWAAETTEIAADVITDLARKYATSDAAFIGMGFGGIDKFANADIAGHALALLPALTGQIGRKGAGVGIMYGHLIAADAALSGWALPEGKYEGTPAETHGVNFHKDPNSIRMVFNIGNTLQQALGNFKLTREWLDSLDLVVTVDPYYNDSALYSDIILPACTFLETNEECGFVQASKHHVLMQQKVLDPPFDTKTDFEIEHELAVRLGFADDLPANVVEYTKAALASDDPSMKGITYDSLLNGIGIQLANVDETPLVGLDGYAFGTPTGLLEIYHENLVDYNQALPSYEAPNEAYAGNPLADKYPLQFSQSRRRYYAHSQFFRSSWIQQIQPAAQVELNPVDADARGIKTGDKIRVFNDRGEWFATASVNNAVRPGGVRSNEGSWMRDHNNTSFQDLINESLIERGEALTYGANIPFNDTLVEIEKA